MIKIDFEFDTQYGSFRDALHLPDDHNFSDSEIQAMKEQRRDAWIASITAPSIPDNTIEIDGNLYERLEGIPPSGAQLIEVDGIWYFKV